MRYLAAGWFAVLTICGHSFHEHGHRHAHEHAACGHASHHEHETECDAEAPGNAFHRDDGHRHGFGHDPEACATCVFFAQAQLQLAPAALFEGYAAPSARSCDGSPLVAATFTSGFDPRGPPFFLLMA